MSTCGENLIGKVIENRYTIERKIADGGMASVYEASDNRLSRKVAVKIMHSRLADSERREQFKRRFRREAHSAASIANSHVVQVYDTGEYDGLDFLVMEYVPGANLRREIRRNGNFSVSETIDVISEILEGLCAAHDINVIHRDIKPENILINSRGHIQITDFGLSRAESQTTLASTGMLLGTASYLPPEMIEKNEAEKSGDVYSVGIIAWEMITGRVPFASENPVTVIFKHVHEDVPALKNIDPGICEQFSDLVFSMTSRDPSARPHDAGEALNRLRKTAENLTDKQRDYRIRISESSIGEPRKTEQNVFRQNTEAYSPKTTAVMPDNFSSGSEAETEVRGLENAETDLESATAKKRAISSKTIAAIISAGAVLTALAVFGWWKFSGPGSYFLLLEADDVPCANALDCTVTGADSKKYAQKLDNASVKYDISYDYSDSIEEGKIISTDPSAVGSHISKKFGRVQIIESKGVKTATVPSDILFSGSDSNLNAEKALADAGFDNIVHSQNSDEYSLTVPQGGLIDINLSPGTTAKHDTAIVLTFSKGLKPVSMPKIEGMSKNDAAQILNSLHINPVWKEEYSDTADKDIIISASVSEGTSLHWSDTVNVTVSKGPETISMPNVTGKSSSEAKSILENLGLKVDYKTQLTIFPSDDKKVAGQSPEAGTAVRKRDKDGNPSAVTITVYTSLF